MADPVARQQIADAWNLDGMPDEPGRDTSGILEAAGHGELEALLIGGVEPADLADPQAALAAIEAAGFVVSLEIRESEVTALADVVFPVAPVAEKAGTYLNWEGRLRSVDAALPSHAASDLRVLQTLAAELGADLGFGNPAQAREDMTRLGLWNGTPSTMPETPAQAAPHLEPGEAMLAASAQGPVMASLRVPELPPADASAPATAAQAVTPVPGPGAGGEPGAPVRSMRAAPG